MKNKTIEKEETLDFCLNKIGALIIFVFKKFNLKTHIECNFTNEENEKFVLSFRTEKYNKELKDNWYNEEQTTERMNIIGQNGNDGEHY